MRKYQNTCKMAEENMEKSDETFLPGFNTLTEYTQVYKCIDSDTRKININYLPHSLLHIVISNHINSGLYIVIDYNESPVYIVLALYIFQWTFNCIAKETRLFPRACEVFNHRTQTFIYWIASFTWKKKKKITCPIGNRRHRLRYVHSPVKSISPLKYFPIHFI